MRIKGNRGQTSYDNEEGKEKIQNVKKSSQNLKKKVYKRVEGRKETLKLRTNQILKILEIFINLGKVLE